MRASYKLMVPDEIDASLTVVMSIKQWKELADQLGTIDTAPYPKWELIAKIHDVIRKAHETFDARHDTR